MLSSPREGGLAGLRTGLTNAVAVEQKYDWGGGAGVRGSEADDYPQKASACKGQKSGVLKPPPSPPPPPRFHHP